MSRNGLSGLLAPFFLCVVLSLSGFSGVCEASGQGISVNLEVVKQIESSGRAHVVNPRTKATGLYQITPSCLKDFNLHGTMVGNKGGLLSLEDMKDPFYAQAVAEWYIEKRIPQFTKTYRLPNSLLVRIACWNWGVTKTRKWYANGAKFNDLPRETREFYKKYKELHRGNHAQIK